MESRDRVVRKPVSSVVQGRTTAVLLPLLPFGSFCQGTGRATGCRLSLAGVVTPLCRAELGEPPGVRGFVRGTSRSFQTTRTQPGPSAAPGCPRGPGPGRGWRESPPGFSLGTGTAERSRRRRPRLTRGGLQRGGACGGWAGLVSGAGPCGGRGLGQGVWAPGKC